MAGLRKTEREGESPEERFLQAFEEYSDALFRHAFIRISDRDKAIDLVHDTFTKVWIYQKKGQEIEAYRSFLYKVLNNLIIDEYRKKRELSLDALLEGEGVDEGSFQDLSEDSTQSLIDQIDGKQAFLLLEELPDIYREVLTLRFVDGLRPKEICQLVEETENVISVRLYRGLKLLQEKLAERERAIKDGVAKPKNQKKKI